MIVYTPLDLPKIEPDNWDTFWEIWNKYSDWVSKRALNHATSLTPVGTNNIWRGMDIFSTKTMIPAWSAPYFDISERLPNMYRQITNLGIPGVKLVRLLSSKCPFGAHSDDNKDMWVIRAFLHHPAKIPQWYFTKPGDPKGLRTYATLPENTNWFAYNDLNAWHGTEYDPENEKILVQLYFHEPIDGLIERSIEKYKDYTINYD